MPHVTLIILLVLSPLVAGATDARETYFEKHIRPLLVERCYECHSASAGKSKGGLLLDSKAGWALGGDSGPALVPGDPERSLLLRAVSYQDRELQMPPKKRLAMEEIAYLKEWIGDGAYDPREGKVVREESPDIDAKDHWSYQPMKRQAVPQSAWARTPEDAFVDAKRTSEGLAPSSDADPYTLLRRLYVTLTGLPPSVDVVRAFVSDASPNALGREADRLLASPRFGEHWGRHWLDVARFAESSGGGRSLMFKNAWRFRDYVIRAFNADVPFDVLVQEHLAGDLLFHREPLEAPRQRERIIGSGFLALGPTNYELQDKELLRMEVVDEQVDTMGRTFMGMTLGCARCHDHKFDPVSMDEYYGLAGIFRSTKTLVPGNVSGYVETALPGPGYTERVAFDREVEKRAGELRLAERRDKKQAQALKKALAAFKKEAPPALDQAMSVRDEEGDEVGDCHKLIRGVIRNLGEQVPRSFLAAATPAGREVYPQLAPGESGRLALAEWLTDPQHSLTARVYVNRLWHHVFGVGLVRTVDNFGLTGEAPSHPELLDALALDFVGAGEWSTKRLLRRLVEGRTFQLGHGCAPQASDPGNRFLWRAHGRPLTAESLRDSMMHISGALDLGIAGLTIEKFSAYDNGYQFGPFAGRTVYAPAFRNARLEILTLFDAANPNMVEGRRSETTLATQALYFLNNPFVIAQATRVAEGILANASSDRERLEHSYLAILGRPPSPEEAELARTHLDAGNERDAWVTLVQSLWASVDFRRLH